MFRWLKLWWSTERGVSVSAIFILAMPLIIGVFGLGFDSLRVLHIKNIIQMRVDSATQAGAAINYTKNTSGPAATAVLELGAPGDPVSGDSALQAMYANYDINTQDMRGTVLACDPAAPQTLNLTIVPPTSDPCATVGGIVGTPIKYNDLCKNMSINTNKYGVRLAVNEKIDTTFLNILAINSVDLKNIHSTSAIRARNC